MKTIEAGTSTSIAADHAAGRSYFVDLDGLTAEAASERTMQAMPVFLGRILPAGLVGLITAAMIAAFMSTHDSYFLCWSSVITNDIIVPLKGELPQRSRVLLTRVIIFLIGVTIFIVSFAFPIRPPLYK